VLTVCAVVVTMVSGSLVTTYRAGLADLTWPTTPWKLLWLSPEQWRDVFLVIEHSHRFVAYAAGVCCIGLVVGLWRAEDRAWLRGLGVAGLLGVVAQGVLGGLRVLEHARWGTEFRVAHGCFAQVVLGMLVTVALFTSRGWAGAPEAAGPPAALARVRTLAAWTAGLVWAQIAFGVLLRQTYSALGQRGHLLLGFAVVFAAAWLIKALAYDGEVRDRTLTTAARCLAGLLLVQILLGVETWLVRFGPGTPLPELQVVTLRGALLRTAHFLTGSLLSAAALAVLLRAYWLKCEAVEAVAAPVGRLEEAA
jgi:cytochrome c oxidase assembly protein subunit 15